MKNGLVEKKKCSNIEVNVKKTIEKQKGGKKA